MQNIANRTSEAALQYSLQYEGPDKPPQLLLAFAFFCAYAFPE
jgi:hypothetical protein